MPFLVTVETFTLLFITRWAKSWTWRLRLQICNFSGRAKANIFLWVKTNSSASTAACDKIVTFCSLRYTTTRSDKHPLNSSITINSLKESKSLALLAVHHLSNNTHFSLANSTNVCVGLFLCFVTQKASQKTSKMTAKTGSKKDLHSFLSASFYLPVETLLAADRSASCHLMMSDSFMSQSADKGGSLRDWQGMEREQAGEREREKQALPTRTYMDVTKGKEIKCVKVQFSLTHLSSVTFKWQGSLECVMGAYNEKWREAEDTHCLEESWRGSQQDRNSVYILVFKDESGKVHKRVTSIFTISKLPVCLESACSFTLIYCAFCRR